MRFVFVALFALASAARFEESYQANPIRRIVSILQKMQKEATAEGERDAELHTKFMCYCKKGAGSLSKEVGDQAAANASGAAEAKEKAARSAQLKQEVAGHQGDRKDAKDAIAEATAMRAKEEAEFKEKAGDLGTNVAALTKAISAISKGMGKSFLQASAGHVEQLKRIVAMSMHSTDNEKQTVISFLASPYGDYQAASGEIVGILKAMKDEMEKDLGTTMSDEKNSVKAHEDLMAAKNAEISASTKAIESKSVRAGELDVEATEAKNAAANAASEADANREFLANLQENCKTKQSEFDARAKERNQEVLAISQAIKILNDDDALEVFKKTLPSPSSFLQTDDIQHRRVTAWAQINAIATVSPNPSRLSLLSFMLKTSKVDFSKVLKMIEGMIGQLGQEQKDDSVHLAWCNAELDSNADAKKAAEQKIKDLSANIDELDGRIKQLGEEMATIKADMEATTENSAEATEQRKKENAEFKKSMMELNAASQLLAKAKNRLNKFYNPAQYVEPPARELTEQERIEQNMGADIGAAPQQMIAGTNQAVNLVQKVDIGEAPKTGSYEKRSGKKSGVTQLMDMLTKDIETQMSEAEHDEKIAQRDYEKLMADAKLSMEDATKSMTQKEGDRAHAKTNLAASKADRENTNKELMATNKEIASLHASCDFLIQNFDFRNAARTREIEGLKNAKAVLSGADYA